VSGPRVWEPKLRSSSPAASSQTSRLIHPTSGKRNSAKFISTILHSPGPNGAQPRHSEKSLSLGTMVRMIVAMIVFLFTEVHGREILRS
jgi:hypothetical protein